MGSLLVDLAHQLSFHLDETSTLDYLKIRKFITYWSSELRSCKHKKIFNYYWRDKLRLNCLMWVFCCVFQRFFTGKPNGFFLVIPRCLNSEPWTVCVCVCVSMRIREESRCPKCWIVASHCVIVAMKSCHRRNNNSSWNVQMQTATDVSTIRNLSTLYVSYAQQLQILGTSDPPFSPICLGTWYNSAEICSSRIFIWQNESHYAPSSSHCWISDK